ncbi:MAG: hypothetical protein KA763_13610, partial [Xanthomonadales bacterium]|nr:hypothetical protein [Xanthomonadales bacterium]
GSWAVGQVGVGVVALDKGHYVVSSAGWANASATAAGAATWCNGNTGRVGVVGTGNSLVGSATDDRVGEAILTLSNGHYVVRSVLWSNAGQTSAGAMTWGDANGGTIGIVGPSNSIVGTTQDERVGEIFLTLSNGNYLVATRNWDNGVVIDAGAVRWGNGNGGSVGAISPGNAIVGTSAGDFTQPSFIEVGNGNYLVLTPSWNNGAATDAGAATWGDGSIGSSGPIGAGVSLVGVRTGDNVGFGAARLANGHYVVRSPNLDSATLADIGAVTWGNGATGSSGIVSATNSLIGVRVGDMVGSSITALANGHYLVSSTSLDSASATNVGAVTWGDGNVGTIGQVTAGNSLTGTKINDAVGNVVRALPEGRALIGSSSWDNVAQANTGAYTVLDGIGPIAGFAVSAANSFIGSAADNNIGTIPQIVAADGRVITVAGNWDSGVAPLNVGAACMLDTNLPLIGMVNASDCVLGSVAGAGATMRVAYDLGHQLMVVGIPAENKIVIFGNRLLSDGFE